MSCPPAAAERLAALALTALALTACSGAGPSSSASPTGTGSAPSTSAATPSTSGPTPSSASTSPGSGGARLALLSRADGSLSWLPLPVAADPRARVDGLRSSGGRIAGTAYALTSKDNRDVLESLAPDGVTAVVAAVTTAAGSLTVEPAGGLLTWSGTATSSTASSSVVRSMPAAGGPVTTLVTAPPPERTDRALQVGRWSTDGRRLYLGEDPVGLGGYDGYFGDGLSSLLLLDTRTGRITRLVPFTTDRLCLDDLSQGERRLADTCGRGVVRIRDLASGSASVVSAPPGSSAYRLLRSARFSLDGTRVAFALVKGDPEAEQGAVAVSASLRGTSRVLATFPSSTVYVDGWLDATTLLVESTQQSGCAIGWCTTTWLVDVGSGQRTKLVTGDQTVVAVDPGRQG